MLRLAVPDNSIYNELLMNQEKLINEGVITIVRLSENECGTHLINNKADAALLTPIGYAKGMYDTDYRVIPGPALLSESYSKAGTIIFAKEMKNAKHFASDFPDDFIITIGRLLLGERYNMFPGIDKRTRTLDEMINSSEIIITWNGEKEGRITLDISDEWFDLNETALPLAFWVCKAETQAENILNIITSLASENIELKIIEELPAGKNFEPRNGKFFLRWNDNFEKALEYTLHFLYYHQLLREIPAVKVLGRD